MQITVNKANQYLEKLKKEVKNFKTQRMFDTAQGRVSESFFITESSKKIYEILKNLEKEQLKEMRSRDNFMEDYYKLKEAIFSFNASSGLSKVLSDIDFTKAKIEIGESMLFDDRSIPSMEEISDIIESFSKKENPATTFTLSFKIYEKDDIKQQVKDLKKKLNELEDKKVELNSQRITIEFTNDTKEFLGV